MFVSADDGLVESSKSRREWGALGPRQTLLLEQSPYTHLDFVVWYHLDLVPADHAAAIDRRWFDLVKRPPENVVLVPLLDQYGERIELDRKPDYELEISKPGFKTANAHLESVSRYDVSSVLLGGLIGWGIDSSTGGNKRLYPEVINLALQPVTTMPLASMRFDEQLTALDDLRAKGRINDEEYATMRRRLVENSSATALVPSAVTPQDSPTRPMTQPPPSGGEAVAGDAPIFNVGDEWHWVGRPYPAYARVMLLKVTDRSSNRTSTSGVARGV